MSLRIELGFMIFNMSGFAGMDNVATCSKDLIPLLVTLDT